MLDTLARLFHQGGPAVMGSILFVLLIAMVLITERAIRYWLQYDLANTEGFMAAIQKMVMNNSIENAVRLCKKASPKLLPLVLVEGLKRSNDSAEEMQHAMEHASISVMAKISRYIAFLGTAANVATLLGLLGTIFGLMHSFGGAARATGAQKQAILAEGIAEALTATSFGLSTALFCILAHGLLSMKQASIVNNINHSVAKLTDLLFTRSVRIKSAKK